MVTELGLPCFLDGNGVAPPEATTLTDSEHIKLLDDPVSRFLVHDFETSEHGTGAVTVDGRYFQQSRSEVAEVVIAISVLAEYLCQREVPGVVRLLIPCGTELFATIAKIRAVRLLSHRVVSAFGGAEPTVEIWGLAGTQSKAPDRRTHQIHLTIAAVAAILSRIFNILKI